jgi:hypothetical protein
MPPICYICQKRFLEGGKLIYFLETDDDKMQRKRMEDYKMVGHPSNAFWFCDEHSSEAVKHSNETKIIALPKIKEFYK